MVAEVDVQHRRHQARRQKPRHRDAAPRQDPAHPRPRVTLTDAVDEDPRVDAALCGAREGVDEVEAAAVALEDVAREKHVAGGLVDGLQHGRERLLAVVQHLDAVARGQLEQRDRARDAGELGELARQLLP